MDTNTGALSCWPPESQPLRDSPSQRSLSVLGGLLIHAHVDVRVTHDPQEQTLQQWGPESIACKRPR